MPDNLPADLRFDREISERPPGYQGPNLSPRGLVLQPHQLGSGVWALMANLVPKDNSGLIVGDHAALIIDAGINPAVAGQIQRLAAHLTDRPLRYLANTTYHGDHTFGNQGFPAEVVVVSSAANRDAMTDLDREKRIRAGNLYGDLDALADVTVWRRPDVAFDRHLEIDLGGRMVQLWHFGPGNGAGDTIVYEPVTRTAWTGNFLGHAGIAPMLLEGGPEPYIASLQAMQATLKVDRIVPGHGPIGDAQAAIGWMIGYLERLLDAVTDLKGRGLSLEQTLDAVPLPQPPAQLPASMPALQQLSGLNRQLHRLNVLAVYRGLEQRQPSPQAQPAR